LEVDSFFLILPTNTNNSGKIKHMVKEYGVSVVALKLLIETTFGSKKIEKGKIKNDNGEIRI
jgi:hypothetical protein